MGIARSITRIPPIIILLTLLVAIGLSTWSLVSTGGEKIEALVERGVDKYDAYVPEITIKQGQASIRAEQPYFFDTGDKDFIVVIDTREGKESAALDYLKDVSVGAVLTRTGITIKNKQQIQIIPLKEFPDMVLNSQNLRKMAQDYLPMVLRVMAILVAFYYVFAKLFQMFILALIPYLAARSYNAELTYGQALKISVIAMVPAVILGVFLSFSNVRIPGWLFFYFVIYIGALVFLTIDLVRSPSPDMASGESINP